MEGATFDIPAGEFVVILGSSGSGKTTLLNMIGALETPISGNIALFGTKLAGLDDNGRPDHVPPQHGRLHLPSSTTWFRR